MRKNDAVRAATVSHTRDELVTMRLHRYGRNNCFAPTCVQTQPSRSTLRLYTAAPTVTCLRAVQTRDKQALRFRRADRYLFARRSNARQTSAPISPRRSPHHRIISYISGTAKTRNQICSDRLRPGEAIPLPVPDEGLDCTVPFPPL